MRTRGDFHTLLVATKTCAAIVESSMEAPQNAKNKITIGPSYPTPWEAKLTKSYGHRQV